MHVLCICFLCPNDVLLGRSDRDPPDVVVADMSLTKRAVYKQKIMSEYWEKWSTSYYQSLMKYSKWKYKSRNAEPGDVVMILDKEHSKGKFALGVVDSVKIVSIITIKTEICVNAARLRSSLKSSFSSSRI